jgi:flagellar hook-associated protein 1 FlgK
VSDVIRFSQAFQANARVIQTISDMLDTLINRTGA